MKLDHEGRRETFPLGTPNQTAAAARARDIYPLLAFRKILAAFRKATVSSMRGRCRDRRRGSERRLCQTVGRTQNVRSDFPLLASQWSSRVEQCPGWLCVRSAILERSEPPRFFPVSSYSYSQPDRLKPTHSAPHSTAIPPRVAS